MYFWLVCCASIRRLIISFSSKRVILSLTLNLKNEVYMYFWLVCCASIRRLIISFSSKRVILSLTLKERGIHVFLACLLCSIRRLIISFSLNGSYCRSRLKNEVYMYFWLVCCASIRRLIISFSSKRVILSLTLKERGIHVFLACLLCKYPSIDHFFQL